MALIKRSAGSRPARFCGERHHTSAPMVPTLLTALSQNGAASPNPAMITPPSAGPTARLILTPTLLAATAGASSGLGTSKGTIDCQAGAVSAPPVPIKNMNSNNRPGVTRWGQTSAAKIADKIAMAVSTAIMNRRLSMISASAPAGIANRNIGSPLATWTNDTDKASASRLVISHPAAALYIQEPMLATTVAVQMTVKTRLRNGLHGEGATGLGVACGRDPLATVIAIRAPRGNEARTRASVQHPAAGGPSLLRADQSPARTRMDEPVRAQLVKQRGALPKRHSGRSNFAKTLCWPFRYRRPRRTTLPSPG